MCFLLLDDGIRGCVGTEIWPEDLHGLSTIIQLSGWRNHIFYQLESMVATIMKVLSCHASYRTQRIFIVNLSHLVVSHPWQTYLNSCNLYYYHLRLLSIHFIHYAAHISVFVQPRTQSYSCSFHVTHLFVHSACSVLIRDCNGCVYKSIFIPFYVQFWIEYEIFYFIFF